MTAYNKQKYGMVPFHVADYPPPSPSPHPVDREHERRVFKKVDESIGEVPQEKLRDFIDLVDHLTQYLTTDTKKVRALFTWLGRQNVLDMKFPSNIDPNTPVGYLKRLKEDTSLYAFYFALLCREADIPCVILQGQSKAGEYEAGDQHSGFTLWNAVYVEEGWRLIHCNWAFVSVVRHHTPGWLKVEEDGQQMRVDNKKNKDKIDQQLMVDENYFFVRPDILSLLCLPEDGRWQLLNPPVSKERFFGSPFITPQFFRCGFTFKRGQSGILNAKYGESSVEIISSAFWKGTLKYMLFYKKNMIHRFPNCDTADRYVAMLNKNENNEIRFILRFPMEGDYILRLYQSKEQVFTRLCDFKFTCDQRIPNCKPFPNTPLIGWGPSRVSIKAELYDFSHKNGLIVLKVQQKQKLEISFRFKGDQRITSSLQHVSRPREVIKDFLIMSVTKDVARIRVDPDVGEFALVINSSIKGTGERNVLNYLIQCGQAKEKLDINRENAAQKKVRQQPREATTFSNMVGLKTSNTQLVQLGVEDKQHLAASKEELDHIEATDGLREAMKRRREDELEKAIRQARDSPRHNQLQEDITKAEQLLKDLRSGNTPKSVVPSRAPSSIVLNNTTPKIPTGSTSLTPRDISGLWSLRITKPVKEVMTATFLLLGENRWRLQVRRVVSGQPLSQKFGEAIWKSANKLLEQQIEEKLFNISPSVWKLYKESSSLVQKCSKSGSIRATSSNSQVSADSGMDVGSYN